MPSARANGRPPGTTPTIAALCIGIVACALIPGCGWERYEERLANTIAFGRYQEKLNKNLSPPWRDRGVELRVPSRFVLIPAPAPPEEKEGEEAEDVELPPDPRQPDFLAEPLPGLLGAWQAEVNLVAPETSDADDEETETDGGNLPSKATGYLYVLGNHDWWLTPDLQERALEFNTDAANAVVNGLEASLPEDWDVEEYPGSGGKSFVEGNKLAASVVESIAALPVPGAEGAEANANDAAQGIELPVRCKMYLAEKEDIRLVIVVILPRNIDPRDNLSFDPGDRNSSLALSLETLKFTGQKPRPQRSGGGRGSGM